MSKEVKINKKAVLVGSDFEMFVVNDEADFISAIPYIDGTKSDPQPVSNEGHMIQHDGVLAEMNVPPVGLESGEEMWKNIEFVMEQASDRLPKGMKLKCCTNGTFKTDQLTDPEANIAGCTPDYNAWNNGEINDKPDLESTPDRCAGLHVHVSWPGCNYKDGMRLIRIFDANLALPLLFVDEDRKRRLLYGKAGCFRFKDFGKVCGVEYRSLSNVVIRNKDLFDWVWARINASIDLYNLGKDYVAHRENIENAINTYDIDQASQLCEDLEIPMFSASLAHA